MNLPCADKFAKLAFEKFSSLPKTGKPTSSEWTILSAIIESDSSTGDSKVVALGAGTKCIGKSKLCPMGLILNDSHAEVLARRGFLRYIYHQLQCNGDIFCYNETIRKFRLKEKVGYHFFSTQVPCGDACIVEDLHDNENEIGAKRRKLDSTLNCDAGEILSQSKVFTGAKLIGESTSDPMLQKKGSLRTKPGRGDRTLSMSCSDKLSKWNILGIQGALLDSALEEPIYMETLNLACAVDIDSMKRAIYGRWEHKEFESKRFVPQKPMIREASLSKFEFAHDASKTPSPNGLVWCDVAEENRPYEISVNGKKQGVTKKSLQTKKSALKICKLELLNEFCCLLKNCPDLRAEFSLKEEDLTNKTYREFKDTCTDYQIAWASLKESYFQQWTTKPSSMLTFNLSTCNKQR